MKAVENRERIKDGGRPEAQYPKGQQTLRPFLRKAWSSSGFSYGPECKAENTPVLH